MLSGVRWHRPVGGFIRHEVTLKFRGVPLLDGDVVAAAAYFAEASSGWGTVGPSTGNLDFPAKRCCTHSR
jgi:hypothetical protein